jgi:hypothetical protein
MISCDICGGSVSDDEIYTTDNDMTVCKQCWEDEDD